MTDHDVSSFINWVGKSQTVTGNVDLFPMRAMAALLGRDLPLENGDLVPLPWHWLTLLDPVTSAKTGTDGHPLRGDFLPPITLERRIWALSKFECAHPLLIGQPVTRRSEIIEITEKNGRSGPLIFVTVAHEYSQNNMVCLCEQQSLVYRHPETGSARISPPPPGTDFGMKLGSVTPDTVMLFRFSALTYNSHRIHYDQPYATSVENYPGLVVHGPLIASLMIDAAATLIGKSRITQFEFRAESPAFANEPLALCASLDTDRLSMTSLGGDGRVLMRATAELTQCDTIAEAKL